MKYKICKLTKVIGYNKDNIWWARRFAHIAKYCRPKNNTQGNVISVW